MARTPDTSGKTGSEELARVIRERRERLGLSRQELADAARIPYPTLAQIETAYRGVSPARLGVLGRVLGLDPKELYDLLASPASDAEEQASGTVAEIAAGEVGGSWHPNPRFAAAPVAARAAAPVAARAAAPAGARRDDEPPADEVVEQVAVMMAGLPADERIAVLAQIQTRVLEDLVALRTPPPEPREKQGVPDQRRD